MDSFDKTEKQAEKTKIRYFVPREPDPNGGGKFSFVRRSKEVIQEKPVPKEKLKKWRKNESLKGKTRTKFHTQKLKDKKKVLDNVIEKSARSEFLRTEEAGEIVGENVYQVTQNDIKEKADEATQQKIFDLRLNQFGPYRIDYTRNGRHLVIGGAKGHVAAFDWQTKKLHCEINVMETVADVKWLHQETLFAVAQKKWVYVYDNQGIEVHCLKHLDSVLRLEFLPYHFLLCSSSSKGYLSYLDVSIGKEVSGICTKQGRLDVMGLNPQSAVVYLGHPNGTVSLWTPSSKEPAAKILCHGSAVRDVAIDSSGVYMATSGMDRRIKIFDLRMYKELSKYQYHHKQCPGLLDFSQKGLLAVTRDNVVEVFKDFTSQAYRPEKPYLYHRCERLIYDVKFCPYEDVLGIGYQLGFSSIVIPGAGEANFDAYEANPYQSKAQRKQGEVRLLLDKVKPEMITVDTNITNVDLETAKELQAEREKKKYLKPSKIDFTPKHKMKGGSSGVKLIQRIKGVQEQNLRQAVRTIVRTKQVEGKLDSHNQNRKGLQKSALDRFKKKN
ncbi:WD repeat-containing protein 46-like [Biomphalaria glabrata]|uniref:WD repeat-containing protein 46-like n=2 Tax=Biomphalaria glabrata TaxID=6526 RepID=A0A9W3BET6_BIOGL|nr:WD repeat-containing protein 46-like [Biomphalaria glabrata]KAI8748852.1 WD repeat-containing protein 46-like [Biomphalaria glabrata]